MIKAIIFDCFGVLVGRGFDETYRMAGGDPDKDRQFITDLLHRTSLGHISQAQFHNEVTAKLHITLDDFESIVKQAELPNVALLAYAKGLRNNYKTAVLSNANRGVIDHKLGSSRVRQCFDEVVVSAEVNLVKPDPQIYEIVAKRLGVNRDECIFIDDQQKHVVGAQQSGMQAIVYADFEQMKYQLEAILVA